MVLNYAKCIVLMLVLVNIDIEVVVCHLSERKSRTAICIENNSRVRRDLQRDHVDDLLADRETVKTENQVAYFSGQEIIRYSNIYFNIDIFTIQFYVQVEGGQIDKVPLIKIYDHCALTEITSTTIGLQEMSEGKDLRMYFELLTASGNITKSLSSHTALEVRKWIHVAAIYDGKVCNCSSIKPKSMLRTNLMAFSYLNPFINVLLLKSEEILRNISLFVVL